MAQLAAGQLKQQSLPRLIWSLVSRQLNGFLALERRLVQKRIWFKYGNIVGIESNLLQDRLDVFLERQNIITKESQQKIEAALPESHEDLPTLLLSHELVDATSLFKSIKDNLVQAVVDCFLWDDGKFIVESSDAIVDLGCKVDPFHILVRAIHSSIPFDRMREDISLVLNKPTRVIARTLPPWTEGYINNLSLKILSAFHEPKKPRYVMQELAIEEEVMLRIVYLFDVTGLLINTEEPLNSETPKETAAVAKPQVKKEDFSTLVVKICDLHLRLDKIDYFTLLGLAPDTTATQAKISWLNFIKQFPLDRFASGTLAEYKDQMDSILLKSAEAYATLSDHERKSKYIDKLKANSTQGDRDKKKPGSSFAIQTYLLDAPTQFKQGVLSLGQKNYKKAKEFFEYACDIDGREPLYTAHLAWTVYKLDPDYQLMATTKVFEDLTKSTSEHPKILHLYGSLLAENGDSLKGMVMLKRAQALSPEDSEIKKTISHFANLKK